ncbi:Putative ubiquitin-conjugating enzyme [Sarcoptes scabiei]|uniref:Putative ubiquitin-conjugating enzyme n=1 Tax=Sarcoptes scabiei TaxID=52283 RepID=A0A834RGP5_SARSC|nr:Putative ubiquitin-conjugating enzyme [Sarcoptes scabiei]
MAPSSSKSVSISDQNHSQNNQRSLLSLAFFRSFPEKFRNVFDQCKDCRFDCCCCCCCPCFTRLFSRSSSNHQTTEACNKHSIRCDNEEKSSHHQHQQQQRTRNSIDCDRRSSVLELNSSNTVIINNHCDVVECTTASTSSDRITRANNDDRNDSSGFAIIDGSQHHRCREQSRKKSLLRNYIFSCIGRRRSSESKSEKNLIDDDCSKRTFQQLSVNSLHKSNQTYDGQDCDQAKSLDFDSIDNSERKISMQSFTLAKVNQVKNSNPSSSSLTKSAFRLKTIDSEHRQQQSSSAFHNHQAESLSPSRSKFTEIIASTSASASTTTSPVSNSVQQKSMTDNKTHSIRLSSKRLMRETADLFHRQQNNLLKANFSIELINDSLYEWYIKIYEFDDKESQIYLDMQEYQIPYVQLHAVFPESYPFEPPFIRVVSPYIERGYVMEGGAICLELLTKTGWTSAYTMEAVIIQLMASFIKGQATIKASKDVSKCFTKKSAISSFRHIVRIHDKHGWVDTPLYEG